MPEGRKGQPNHRDLAAVVEKVQRPEERSTWLALAEWRTDETMLGEALLDRLKENA